MATQNAINLTASGMVSYDGSGSFLGRTITAGSSKINITTGDGISGNPTIDATEANFTLDNIGGTLSVSKGGTGATSLGDGFVLLGSGTGAITALDVTAKGSILAGDGTTDPVALAVGSNGLFLKADSGEASGLIWAAASPFSWVVETTTSRSAAVNEAVITNNASLVTVTIPDTAAVGDQLKIVNIGAGLFKIGQNASESIVFGNATTTTGVGGSITATDAGDSIELVCTVANTTWQVLSSVGNFTIV